MSETNLPEQSDAETETLFSETLMAVLRILDTLPRHEREELLHHVKCSLAEFNRMYAQAFCTDDDDMEGAFAALRENGFESTIDCVLDEDEALERTTCVDIHGVSALRDSEFHGWTTHLLKPFGGYVDSAGYADPPGPGARRPTDH
jgi:hypothetical protein